MRIPAVLLIVALVAVAVPLVPTAAAGHDYFCDTTRLNPICAPAHDVLEILYQCLVPPQGCWP